MARRPAQDTLNRTLDAYQAGLAAQGDRRAFELLYRRWHPRGLRLAQRLTRNRDDARDVMQDAALTIARDISKLRDPARFSAWAYTIVRRRAADHIERAVRRRTVEADVPDPVPLSGPDSALALKQALARMSATDRTLLELFYIDGFRGREIADALGLPLGTVKSRLFAARARLKHIYNEGDEND